MCMKSAGKTNTLLMELIIVILFFSLSAVITLQLFVTAHEQSTLSHDKTMALLRAQNVAEELRADESSVLTGFSELEEDRYMICYNEDWEPSGETGAYEMSVQVERKPSEYGTMMELDVRVNKGGQELCSLQTSRYLPAKEDV